MPLISNFILLSVIIKKFYTYVKLFVFLQKVLRIVMHNLKLNFIFHEKSTSFT